MPEQGRLGDKARCPADGHGCLSCAHDVRGPATAGSSDVYVNDMNALRVDDPGVHASCCGPNTWKAAKGSSNVYFNGKKAHRKGDQTKHCGGNGELIEGSSDVFVGSQSTDGDLADSRQELHVALLDHEGNYIVGVDFTASGPATYRGTTADGPVVFKNVPGGDYTIQFGTSHPVEPGGSPRS